MLVGSLGAISGILTRLSTSPTTVIEGDSPEAARARALIQTGENIAEIVIPLGGVALLIAGAGLLRHGRRHLIELASEPMDT